MPSFHRDKLVKSFLETSSPMVPFNPFADLQDPTYVTFKLDFFPDTGLSMPDDGYSMGGLFRKDSEALNDSIFSYSYYDSAASYLRRIGAPNRQAYLAIFHQLLYDIQTKAPWYFQTIAGLGELYKIDPANNYRGKDKELSIECLESIDLRMTLLADLYRNIAFDMENMREVLPINLRTFTMAVHVLEFRNFNTTFGIISDFYGNRATSGQANQQAEMDARRRNVYNQSNTSLFTGTLDNLNTLGNAINDRLGGMFTNMGDQAGNQPSVPIKSAFEAISVQTFYLRGCEFDFFSEAPPYLDTVSVKEMPEAVQRFKIKVRKIEKISSYSFDKYVISEIAKHSRLEPPNPGSLGISPNMSEPYFEEREQSGPRNQFFSEYRNSIFPENSSAAEFYNKQQEESDFLRRKPLERALGGIIRNATNAANQGINQVLGNITGGVLGTNPLGNIYDRPTFYERAREVLNDFLTPGTQITSNQQSAVPPSEVLQNISFQALNLDTTVGGNVFNGNVPSPGPGIGDENVFEGNPPATEPNLGDINVFDGSNNVPPNQVSPGNNVFGSK